MYALLNDAKLYYNSRSKLNNLFIELTQIGARKNDLYSDNTLFNLHEVWF